MADLFAQLGTSGIIALLAGYGTFRIMGNKIETMAKDLDKSIKSNSSQWAKIDDIHSRLMVFENRLKVISTMLQPDKLAEHSAWVARTENEIKHLRIDVEKIDTRTKCGECK